MLQKEQITKLPFICAMDPIRDSFSRKEFNSWDFYVPRMKSKARWYFSKAQIYTHVRRGDPIILLKEKNWYDSIRNPSYWFLPLWPILEGKCPKEAIDWDEERYWVNHFYPTVFLKNTSEYKLILE